jgi:hypothetical protein
MDVKVADLVHALDQLQHIYGFAGAKAPAKELRALVDILSPYGDYDLAFFLTRAREALNEPKGRKSKTSAKRSTPATPVNPNLIVDYVTALKSTGTNQVAFDKLFSELTADKRLKLRNLTEIAQQYSGGVSKHRTIAAARDEILKAFIRHARFVNKLG